MLTCTLSDLPFKQNGSRSVWLPCDTILTLTTPLQKNPISDLCVCAAFFSVHVSVPVCYETLRLRLSSPAVHHTVQSLQSLVKETVLTLSSQTLELVTYPGH